MLKIRIKDHWSWDHSLSSYRLPGELFLYPIVSPETHVGIEVEVENLGRYDTTVAWANLIFQPWGAKNDGSLREGGIEFVSKPIRDQEIPYALNALFDTLPPGVTYGMRTSTHIHLNFREGTFEHILNMCILSLVFEQLLFQFAGETRYSNIYCTPIQETKLLDDIRDFAETSLVNKLLAQWDKYSGMNLLPLISQGTIEFRQLRGTSDKFVILEWINLLLRLKLFAETNTFEAIITAIKPLNTNSQYEAFAREVFKDQIISFYNIAANFKLGMENGVATAKLIDAGCPFQKELNIHEDSVLIKRMEVRKKKAKRPVTVKDLTWMYDLPNEDV